MTSHSLLDSNLRQPLVTIGLPVYNGERYLAKTIESLIAQDYPNLEIIIADNASEDGTADICRAYAARDPRITYLRNATNIGPMKNGCRLFDEASGEFIMFAADHDLWAPNFVSTLLPELLRDESVVLAYFRTVLIDEQDRVTEILPDRLETRGLGVCQRFHKIMWEFAWGNMVYGLFRTEVYRQVWKPYEIISPDHLLMASLSLHGQIVQVDEPLFFRRTNRPRESAQEARARWIGWFSKPGLARVVPRTLMAYEHLKLIMESRLTDAEKELLLGDARNCFRARFGEELTYEIGELLAEGTKILNGTGLGANLRHVEHLELAKLAHICKFFYPEAEQLDRLFPLPPLPSPARLNSVMFLRTGASSGAGLPPSSQPPAQPQEVGELRAGMEKAGLLTDELTVGEALLQSCWSGPDGFGGVAEMVAYHLPDVVYLHDLRLGTPQFLQAVRPSTRLIAGFASGEEKWSDLSGYDLVFAASHSLSERLRAAGVRASWQPPGFEPQALKSVTVFPYDKRPVACSFVGGISPRHAGRVQLLEHLAATVPIDVWGYGADTLPAGSLIRKAHHGEAWGREMLYILGASRITINRHAGSARGHAGNGRLFEATGLGALLITDHHDNLGELFEIGKEILAYRSPGECEELVRHYLAHPEEAGAIARAGQQRTLRDHTCARRAEQTGSLLASLGR